MQGLEPEEHDLPHNPSNEGTINEEIASEIGSIAPPSDHPEGEVEIIEEGSMSLPQIPLLLVLITHYLLSFLQQVLLILFLLTAYHLICTVGDLLAWMQQHLTIQME
jgi:hypothetical protein